MFGKIRVLLSFLRCFGFREYRAIMAAAEMHLQQRREWNAQYSGQPERRDRELRWYEIHRALWTCWDYDCIGTYREEHGIKADAKRLGEWYKDKGV